MRKKDRKREVLFLLVLVVTLLAGCGKNTASVSKDGTAVGLKWYLTYQDQKDTAEVMAKVKEVVKKNINADLTIERIDFSSYNEKIKLIVAANENFDLLFTAPNFNYYEFARKGALKDIGDMIKNYAPKSYAAVPADYWEATKVNGKTYGFINYQIVARQFGFVMHKQIVDKYKFDYQSMKYYEDLEPLLEQVKKGEPEGIIPLQGSSVDVSLASRYDIRVLDNFIAYSETEGSDYKLFNIWEHEKTPEVLKSLRDWYNKGYFASDAATITNGRERIGAGTVKCWWDMCGPGFEPSFKEMAGGNDVITKVIMKPYVTTSNVIATMQAVSATSKNPEKAIELLELINTNVDNIYNIMNFGIEGKHYTKVSDTRIKLSPDTGWYPNVAWEFGNQFNAYLVEGQEDGVWEKTKELNNTASKSKLLGFVFDNTSVKSQVAQCTGVIDEYSGGLSSGSLDVDTYYPQFIKKLKQAGADVVIAEAQRQVDEWVKTKKIQ